MALLPAFYSPNYFMGFFDRLSRLLRSNLNDFIGKVEDPVKILDQSMSDMQDDLVKLRQAVAMAISSQKRLQNKFEQSQTQIKSWYERAELALRKGEEDLAKEALLRRKTLQDTSDALTNQLNSQNGHVDKLKRSLLSLESKIAEVKTKKDMLKARAQAAKAKQQLENVVGGMGTNSAMAAFERMEDKVEALEASSEAAAELAGSDLETKFSMLEGGTDIDEELESLRKSLKDGIDKVALPQALNEELEIQNDKSDVEIVEITEVDEELDELKKIIDINKD